MRRGFYGVRESGAGQSRGKRMSVLAQAVERRKRFHADIARRAALLAPKADRSYSIPNTPFGVTKPAPEVVKTVVASIKPTRDRMRDWYHCMWFFDLIEKEEEPRLMLPGVEYIQEVVAQFYGLSRCDLISDSRVGKLIRPRHVAMYLCRQFTRRSLPQIAKRFGGRDHSTAIHAVKKVSREILIDENLAADVAALTALVQL
jgi:hypothetical protein